MAVGWRPALLAGLVAATVVAVLALAVVPLHVTYGAGDLRCGTALRPDRASEVAHDCPAAARHRRASTAPVAVAVGAVAALPWLFVRRGGSGVASGRTVMGVAVLWSVTVLALAMTIVGLSQDLSR